MKRLTNTLNSGRIYAVYILNNLWWINPPEKEIIFMKILLSMILAMLMVLSTVSFAAPAMVGSVAEVTEDVTVVDAPAQAEVVEEAELAAESDYGTLVYTLDFEDATAAIPAPG